MEQVSHAEFLERVHDRLIEEHPGAVPTKADTKRVIDAALREVRHIMAAGDKVQLSKFGQFWAKEREATNPSAFKTGKGPTRINTVVAKFKASANLRAQIKKGFGLE